MQLTSLVAAPPAATAPAAPAAPAAPSLAAKLAPLVSALRGDAAPTTDPAPEAAPAVPVDQPAAGGAALLGRVGSKQNQYLANQQLLGAISTGLTERVGFLAKTAWAMLRGTAEAPTAPDQAA